MGGGDEIDDRQDNRGKNQGHCFFEKELKIHQLVSGNRVGKSQGNEGLEQNGEFRCSGRNAVKEEGNDIEEGEGNDAQTKTVDNPLQLLFEEKVRRLDHAVEDGDQSQDRKKGKMEEVQFP